MGMAFGSPSDEASNQHGLDQRRQPALGGAYLCCCPCTTPITWVELCAMSTCPATSSDCEASWTVTSVELSVREDQERDPPLRPVPRIRPTPCATRP